jgi:hypothetical protein
MRCPGPPYNLGPYCWRDNAGKKHYKLKTHHLKGLIRHVEEGGTLETHDDIPDDIREQLYAEEQQDVERQRKRRASTVAGLPPINITNVLPPQIQTSTEMVLSKPPSPLEIPGQLDVTIRKYSEWQCSRVTNKSLKMEYQKVYQLTLAEGLDLELIYKEQNAQFYINKGIKIRIAQRFVRDTAACRIAFWLFARTLTLLLHRPISLRARFAYLSLGAVRSTAYHKHSTTHLDNKLEILLFSSCYYPYALSPPSSSIKTLQSVSFGLQPNLASLSALVLSPQPHMIGPNG